MAELTIRLRTDPATGKKDILVDLQSDADALPHEHEQHHRALVQRLIEGGILRAEEVGEVVVGREAVATPPESAREVERTSAPERASAAEGAG